MPNTKTNNKKKAAKKKTAKKKVVKPEFEFLNTESKRTVLAVAKSELKKDKENKSKIWKLLDTNKANHIKLALEIYKYAEKMKLEQANQTLKNIFLRQA